MSIRVMTAVWDSGAFEGGTLLVLLALADWAQDDGSRVYPKIEQLAKKARLSDRQTTTCLKNLRAAGIIFEVEAAKRGRPTEYRIDVVAVKKLRGKNCTATERDEVCAGVGVKSETIGVKSAPAHIEQPSEQPSGNRHSHAPDGASERPASPGWKEFRATIVETWPGTFPSDNEAKARKAFDVLTKTIPAETLIACAAAHGAAKTAIKSKRGAAAGAFLIQSPSNWLKDRGFEGYADDVERAKQSEANLARGLARAHIGLGQEIIDIFRSVGMTETEIAKMDGASFLGGSQPCFTVETPFQGEILRRHGQKLQRALGSEDMVVVLAGTERRSA